MYIYKYNERAVFCKTKKHTKQSKIIGVPSMRSKAFNIVVLVIFLGFSAFFGIYNYNLNLENAQQDTLFESQLSAEVNDITKEIADDINISNSNQAANERGTTSGSVEDGTVDVYFNNFYEMYDYAVTKYNNATYVYTTASGSATLKGTVENLGLTVDTKASLSFVKAKSQKERYFSLALTGGIVIEGMNNLSITTKHYTNGTVYKYQVGSYPVVDMTQTQYETQLGWDMTKVFHLADADLANSLTEDEIISFMYDSNAKEYTAKVQIDTSSFNTNYATIMQTVANATSPAKFSKIIMTIKVDSNGNFKSISYMEDYTARIIAAGLTVSGQLTSNYSESFTIINNGYVKVTNPFG